MSGVVVHVRMRARVCHASGLNCEMAGLVDGRQWGVGVASLHSANAIVLLLHRQQQHFWGC